MTREQTAVGIDVGSASVRIVVGTLLNSNEEQLAASGQEYKQGMKILGQANLPSVGMQKGVVNDVESLVEVLSQALDRAERVSGVPIEHAVVSINGSHMTSESSRGVIAVSRADGEITGDDVSRVINAAQAVSLPSNREIVHVLPQDFIVDGQEKISDPVGMTGVRLEVETHMIEGSVPFIKNLAKVVNQAGVHIEDLVFAPLAAAASVLDKRQKELGVVVVDLGAGTTSLAVYEDRRLLHTAVLPLGSGHITNDIAIGLRTSIEIAEEVKKMHGTALSDEVKANEMILIDAEDGEDEQDKVSRKEVSDIIRDRLDEIFSFVDKELQAINRSGLLPAGVVFTGGGANLPGVVEVAKKRLRLPARVGSIPQLAGLGEDLNDPTYAVALGLLKTAFDQTGKSGTRVKLKIPDMGATVGKMRGWFKSFLP